MGCGGIGLDRGWGGELRDVLCLCIVVVYGGVWTLFLSSSFLFRCV